MRPYTKIVYKKIVKIISLNDQLSLQKMLRLEVETIQTIKISL